MLNIKINKIEKMGDFFGFGGGNRKEVRSDLRDGERQWIEGVSKVKMTEGETIEEIKNQHNKMLEALAEIQKESKNPKKSNAEISRLDQEKFKAQKRRNELASNLDEHKRKALESELNTQFVILN